MLMIGNSPKVFPFRSKTIYERCFLACPAPNYGNSLFGAGRFVRFSAISIAYWRFMLACWQTCGYFNNVSNNSQQKNGQKRTFFGHPEHHTRLFSPNPCGRGHLPRLVREKYCINLANSVNLVMTKRNN